MSKDLPILGATLALIAFIGGLIFHDLPSVSVGSIAFLLNLIAYQIKG